MFNVSKDGQLQQQVEKVFVRRDVTPVFSKYPENGSFECTEKKGWRQKKANAQDSPAADFDCIITDSATIESVIHCAFFESKPSKSKPAKSKH